MGVLYGLLLLGAIIVSNRYRNREAQIFTWTMAAGSLGTLVIFVAAGRTWAHLNAAVLMIDVLMLGLFALIAFRSLQRWTLIVCAMQFIGAASHIAGLIADTPTTRVIGVVQGVWAFLQCFVIISGTIYNRMRATSAPSLTGKG